MSGTVIIAAMEREVKPLLAGWRRAAVTDAGRSFQAFEGPEAAVVVSGIGRGHAEAAARAAMARYRPERVISAGLAGALIRSLKAGSVVTPNVVVDAADGREYRLSVDAGGVIGGGVLVSTGEIAGAEAKSGLVERFHALVVDMEAAAVARVAEEGGVEFRCVKAISDEAGFVMPPLQRFVDADGNFQSGSFALWAALRPWQWARVASLGRNSAKATRALCGWLAKHLRVAGSQGNDVVTLKREFPEAVSERR